MGRGGKVTRYPEELKQTAVEMALVEGNTIVGVARDLGISDKTLHTWVSKYRADRGLILPANDQSLEVENKRLRKENARLKMERDILKKATAYFAKETL